MSKLRWSFISVLFAAISSNFSCSKKEGDFFSNLVTSEENSEPDIPVPVEPRRNYIILSGGGVANSVNTTVSLHSLTGEFIHVLVDYAKTAEWARGLAWSDQGFILTSIEGADRIEAISLSGVATSYAASSSFAGNVFHMTQDDLGNLYVVEGNTVEKFNAEGDRVPLIGATPYISTTLGACTLSTPHGLAINSLGQLVVMSTNNNRILVYDVSSPAPTCVNSVTYNATGIWDVVQHPNGLLYIVAQTTDALYSANPDGSNLTLLYQYTPNTANPGSIAVLPDQTLLVGTHGTNSIDLFDVQGNRLKEGFIKSAQSVQVNSILVTPEVSL